MDRGKHLYLADKYNAIPLERAAILLGHDTKRRKLEDYKEIFALQVVHTGFGGFPVTSYKITPPITAKEVIGIERCLGLAYSQNLPIEIPSIEKITSVDNRIGTRAVIPIGESNFKTFLEVFDMEIGTKLEDSVVKELNILKRRK